MDILRRAWDLLGEGERPEGMECRHGTWYMVKSGGITEMIKPAAYDRLCQAVEGVNLSLGLMHYQDDDLHVWMDGSDVVASWPDRMTAACNALEAERGGA